MSKRGRIGVVGLVACVVIAGTARRVVVSAQGADKAASEKTIIASENKVTEAVAKGDLGAFKALVASDGWAIDAGGPMQNSEFEKNFKQAKIDPGWKITNTKVIWVASNTAVLFYKWTGTGSFMGQPLPPVVYASTVWHQKDGKWAATFHQETAAAPGK